MSYNPFSLENKTILVTGASSGIGRATAVACSKMGASVIITARNEERLKETLEKGEAVKIFGFGNFSVHEKTPRPGRNPRTGEEVTISQRRVVTFKMSNSKS